MASRLLFALLFLGASSLAAADPPSICTDAATPSPHCQRRGECAARVEDRSSLLFLIADRISRDAQFQHRISRVPSPRRDPLLKVIGMELVDLAGTGQPDPESDSVILKVCFQFGKNRGEGVVGTRLLMVTNCRNVATNVSSHNVNSLNVQASETQQPRIQLHAAALTLPGDYVITVSILEWADNYAPVLLAEHCEALTVTPMIDADAIRKAIERARKNRHSQDSENVALNRCLERLELSPAVFDALCESTAIKSLQFRDRLIRPEDLRQMARLRHLTALTLTNVPLDGWSSGDIQKLESLESLALINCDLPPDATSRLEVHPRLKQLQIRGSTLAPADFIVIRRMEKLESLEHGNCNVVDANCEAISELTGLQKLNLSGTSITSHGIEHLRRLSNLESLDLSYTGFSIADLDMLPLFRRLRGIGIAGTDITPTALRAALERRVLDDVRVDGRQQNECKALFPEARVHLWE
jgi:hypothetical protein